MLRAPESLRSLVDGAHGGTSGFFFLPPMVQRPNYTGTFDESLSPAVEICELNGASCSETIAAFTENTGPGTERVRADNQAQHYQVNLHTNEFALDHLKTYRIIVRVAGTELGHADVVLVSNSSAKNTGTGDVITLVDGRTLPIRFRIEEGTVAAITSDGGSATLAAGGVTLAFPAGAVEGEIGVTATAVAVGVDGTDTSVLPGTLYDFQPSPTEFAQPVTLSIAYPASLLAGMKEERLAICRMVDGGACRPIKGSRVDPVARTVTAEITGFSEYAITEWPEILRCVGAVGRRLFTAQEDILLTPNVWDGVGCGGDYPSQFVDWSPNGLRLAFSTLWSSVDRTTGELRLIDWHGDGETILPTPPPFHVDWSPTGAEILLVTRATDRRDGWVLMTMGADGAGLRTIANVDGNVPIPSWSPDGLQIAFFGQCGEGSNTDPSNAGLCVVNADGTGLRLVSANLAAGSLIGEIVWSPDGATIAFIGWPADPTGLTDWTSDVAAGDGIWLINSDGTGLRFVVRCTYTSFPCRRLSWSPSGEFLLYDLADIGAGNNMPPEGVYVVRPDGTDERKIAAGYFPAWSPDGRRVAFYNGNVFLVNLDGTGLQRLSDVAENEGIPFWRP